MNEKNYGVDFGEWSYSRISPQVLVEPFMGAIGESLMDYKLWTFHGKVEMVQVDTGRERDHRQAFYDRNWKRLPFSQGYPEMVSEMPPPRSLEAMIAGAEMLSEDIPFVRVDLYEVAEQPVFGEMTFFPNSGIRHFSPPEYDAKLGALWREDKPRH
jgi:hypothetical protein